MIEGLENCSVIVYRLPIVSMVGELAFICVVLLGATRTKDMMVLAILSARCQSGLISMKRSTWSSRVNIDDAPTSLIFSLEFYCT